MKTILLIALSLFIVNGCAPIGAMPAEKEEVITIEDHQLNQKLAYDRALIWFAETYNSSNDVIQLQDEASGIIVAKGAKQINRGIIQYTLGYTMKVDFNEEQVKFTQTIGQPIQHDIGAVTNNDADKMHVFFTELRTDMLNTLITGEDF